MIKTCEAPCWYLVDRHGNEYDTGDGTPHFGSEAEARKYADDRELVGLHEMSPKQYDERCVTVACDGCDGELDDDAWDSVHFTDEESARRGAEAYDWQTSLGPGVLCEDCEPIPPVSSTDRG